MILQYQANLILIKRKLNQILEIIDFKKIQIHKKKRNQKLRNLKTNKIYNNYNYYMIGLINFKENYFQKKDIKYIAKMMKAIKYTWFVKINK